MSASRPPAPLYVDAMALAEWLLRRLGGDDDELAQRICRTSFDLAEAVTLALKGRRRDEQLEQADELLLRLRVQLRLAEKTERLSERRSLHALERADGIGRQLGGWLRSLGPV